MKNINLFKPFIIKNCEVNVLDYVSCYGRNMAVEIDNNIYYFDSQPSDLNAAVVAWQIHYDEILSEEYIGQLKLKYSKSP